MIKRTVKRMVFPLLTVIVTSIFPAVFLYCRNAGEAGFGEILPAIFLFAGLGIILFLLFCIPMHSANKAGVIASVFILILTNYGLIEKVAKHLFPFLKYWHILPILLMLALHMAFFIKRWMPDDLSAEIIKVECMVFLLLTVINAATGIPGAIHYMQAQNEIAQSRMAKQQPIPVQSEGKRNIYLLLFDEYAGFAQMEKYYGYDNRPLKDFLTENNFSVSYTSHNESNSTRVVLTNLVNLDYVVNADNVAKENETLRKNGRLYDLMREQGYQVEILELYNFMGGHIPQQEAASGEAVTVNGENLYDICIRQSAFYPFAHADTAEAIEDILMFADYLSDKESLPEGGTFTLAYFVFPHQPFIVDENGAAIPQSQSSNWEDSRYYLGQYKYATKLILSILDNIIQNDPEAVIILQSDHGARATTHKDYTKKFPMEIMTNNFNAVYFGGDKLLDIEGQSSINTVRMVLNQLWGTDYEMLELPSGGVEDDD